MSTQFTNRQWRLPNNENKDKQSNYSMDFDGSSYISCGDVPLEGVYTISFWINPDASPSSLYFLLDKTDVSPSISTRVTQSSNNTIRFQIGSSNFSSTDTLTNNSWNNVILIANGSSSKIYINNGTAAIGTLATAPNTTDSFFIGTDNAQQSAYFFNGQIDGVAIFNYALTDGTGGTVNQIAALYGSSSTGIGNPMSLSPAPVAYYPLGDQDAFNGADYLVPNSSLKDYVFSFDADYIDTFEIPATYTALTLSCWVNFDNLTAYSTVLGQWVNNSFANSTVLMYLDNTGKIQVLYSTGSSYTRAGLNTTLSTNTWYNLVTTWDGTTVKLYVNSFLQTTTGSLSSLNDANVTLKLGAYNSGASTINHLDGKLSNAQIFNSALSATGSNSVETLYNNGSPLTSMSGFTSLQGWWKLDASATYDGSDWTVPDDSSNSNDGTSSGMTQANLVQSDLSFTSGYSPYALLLDGTDDYINCGNDSSLVPSSQITLSLWFKTSGSASAIPRLINKSYGGSPYDSYFIRINNNVLNFKIGVSSASVQISGTTNVVDGNWHNVIGTYDGSQLKLYLDGNSEATPISETRAIIENTSYNLTLGCEFGAYGFSWPFTGSMSNVSIWNAGLTSAQVTEIYNEGVPSNLNNHSAYSNLVSWWQLGSNTSWVDPYWIALDEKGTKNGESQNVAAPNNMGENAIVDGVGSYANGLSSGMSDNIVGSAPFSDANSLSVNMDVEDRTTDTPS